MPINYIIIIVLILALVKKECTKEGFTYFKPGEIDKRVEMLSKPENKKYFNSGSIYSNAAVKWNWLDPIVYYDLADLVHNKKYTSQNIRGVFKY